MQDALKLNAIVSIPKDFSVIFSIADLEKHFGNYNVELRNIKLKNCKQLSFSKALEHTEVAILNVYGFKDDLRISVRSLYKTAMQKHKGLENKIADFIPANLIQQSSLFNNEHDYQKHYEQFTDKYIRHCLSEQQNPHPEVLENLD